jgi:hypothetical protein
VIAPYLNRKKSTATEESVFEEPDTYAISLPSITSGSDLKIRIPPELMPDEETALHYFDIYFTNVHPYVPVLNKSLFYQRWHNNRESISPLILEAIFAIAGKLADEPSQGQQWLALATRKFKYSTMGYEDTDHGRTCGCIHGCCPIKYPSGDAYCAEGPRIST